jgi:uncharacterized protein YndB with AHSA1/START domain
MQVQDFSTSFLVAESPEKVFNAVTNVRGWWSEQIEGRTDGLNEVFNYHYQDVHRCRMKIIDFVPDSRVVWLVEDNYFNFVNDKSEWKNTEIIFEISKTDDQTELKFTHKGLVPAYECYAICADSWGNYIRGSLKDLVVNGIGNPNPYQASIDNAEKKKSERTKSFTETFLIDKAPATVFNAINEVSKWWCSDLKGLSAKVGDEFEVRFGTVHYSRHKLVDSFPFKRIVWLVTDSRLSFAADQQEWTGTKNIFEIEPEDGRTRMTFTHEGLQPDLECFSSCVKGWKYYLEESLLPFISDGKGNPGR